MVAGVSSLVGRDPILGPGAICLGIHPSVETVAQVKSVEDFRVEKSRSPDLGLGT